MRKKNSIHVLCTFSFKLSCWCREVGANAGPVAELLLHYQHQLQVTEQANTTDNSTATELKIGLKYKEN